MKKSTTMIQKGIRSKSPAKELKKTFPEKERPENSSNAVNLLSRMQKGTLNKAVKMKENAKNPYP